jgi:hypothetical protein
MSSRCLQGLQIANTTATDASTAARQDWTRAPSLGRSRTRDGDGDPSRASIWARPMKASSAHWLLPFETFGEVAAFDLEVEVSCQCGRCVVIDGMASAFRNRRIMGTRFRCTTMLPHGVACPGLPSIYIRKRGRGRWTMADHSRAIRARQAAAPIDAKPGTFASIVKRCEVAFLYDRGCVPSYTVAMIEFDEPPWDRFLDKPWGRFICPGCGQTLDMHVSNGPGTPGTERFLEAR